MIEIYTSQRRVVLIKRDFTHGKKRDQGIMKEKHLLNKVFAYTRMSILSSSMEQSKTRPTRFVYTKTIGNSCLNVLKVLLVRKK